jgi:putative transposase
MSDLVERIAARCHETGIPAPNWRTIHSRVLRTDAERRARRRQDYSALAKLLPVPGEFTAAGPLDVVQIDHTPVDVFVVDAEDRLGMARPWLTLAIDVHTRMVVGYHLSLNEPSVISVGLCLLNAVFDKSALLEGIKIDASWPSVGMPRTVHVDNGSEFHSKAFLRGCQEHGIHIDWRPPGTPRYGGHIERLIGTQMGAVHMLPGSTGSSIADRQGRDAQADASLTMRELERWVLLEIVGKYHHKIHSSLNRPPIALWRELAGSTPLRLPPDRLAFWVAFLPEYRRLLRRDGIHLFGIRYWSSALSQDIGRMSEGLKVRYDPRDLSTIFVRRSNGHFVEARYRTLGRPAISLWERNAAARRLSETGRKEINEDMIFTSVLEQRAIEDDARHASAQARRNRERRPAGTKEKQSEIRLRDIDMAAALHHDDGGSPWD